MRLNTICMFVERRSLMKIRLCERNKTEARVDIFYHLPIFEQKD